MRTLSLCVCAVVCWWMCVSVSASDANHQELVEVLDSMARQDEIPVIGGVTIKRATQNSSTSVGEGKSEDQVLDKLQRFTRTHVLDIRVPEVVRSARELTRNMPRFSFGKNSFLTGFGLGFLAFGLKKLLLPLFIGAQIVKSVLLAMFLPSIIGGIAKLMGKGLTSVAHSSSSSASNPGADTITDFDFKDTGNDYKGGYDSLGAGSDDSNTGVWTYPPDNNFLHTAARQPFPAYTTSGVGATSSALKQQLANDRFQKYSFHDSIGAGIKNHQGSFYSHDKQQDFKVFHNIPASSQLLANYDPFYSPLLSRLDSVFVQLGHVQEGCRERLVCEMYSNPAKYAPYSNLVSAQLSRELNELRKPASDNPEILRFFRYMKAAKDGQDGQPCLQVYDNCAKSLETQERPPMVTTFNHINKLVQARKLSS